MIMGYAAAGEVIGASPVSTVEEITTIEVSNAIYDDFFGQRLTDESRDNIIPDDSWKAEYYLHAKFNGTIYCGNADFSAENTKHLLLKRRKKGEFQWFTLYDIPANGPADYTFTRIDPYAPAGELEYAVVPIINNYESDYSIAEINYTFDGAILVEPEKTIWTVTDLSVTENANYQLGTYNTLEGRYPYVFYNGENNYITGSLSSTFIKIDPEKCIIVEPAEMHKYYAEVMNFLRDRRTKILKYSDGRIRMIEVTTPPSDEASDNWNVHTISFDYTEIGSIYSNEDMNRYGFLNVGEEWWVK